MSTTKQDATASAAATKEDPQTKSEEKPHRITANIVRQSVAKEAGVEPDNVNILNFEVKAGSKPGDGFVCEMKSVNVQAEVDFGKGKKRTKEYIYIVKCIPANNYQAMMINETNMFETECAAYSTIVPNMNKLKKDDMNPISVANSYFVSNEEGVIVMEDLRLNNFYMGDKRKGLSMTQMKLVLKGLSNFHATSYHWMQTYTGGLEQFRQDYSFLVRKHWFDGCSQQMEDMFESMFQGNYSVFLQIVSENCKKEHPDMVAALERFTDKRSERFTEAQANDEDGFNVILHSDSWCNNFMFRNDSNGQPAELKILDMQLLRIASPVVDLAYFFGSSTTPELRRKELDNLLKHYHDNLISNLTSFGYSKEVFTFEQLKQEFKERFIFGFILGQMHTQLLFAPEDDPTNGWDAESMGDVDMTDSAVQEEMMKVMQERALKFARENEGLKARYIDQAKEAYEMGIL